MIPGDVTWAVAIDPVESKEHDYPPVLKAFLAGSFSGTFSTVLFQPLDLVKTRLQSAATPVHAAVNGRGVQPGMINIVTNIVKQDHIIGLWRGMVPSITRCVPGVGLYFSSLHWLKGQLQVRQPGKDIGALQAVGLGVVARTMSGVLLIPFTVVKTRFESGVYGYNSVLGALRDIWRVEGPRGLYCGLGPTLARDAPFSGLYLMFYTQGKKAIPEEWLQSPTQASALHFSCGVASGVLASVATNPADVIKTRMQLFPDRFPSVLSAAIYVQQTHGMTGYLSGIVPRMLRRTLMAAMAWTVYEEITRSMGLK
ncbi:mitochondrial glycine transporter B-like isoform X2 [Arctopsyche grandis]|uniref:mitochondrial glycine transporter B-like isoform X2 n=1 Tax=Arctopsyche grandis TaxID=121162 RepID=UPI00406D6B10